MLRSVKFLLGIPQTYLHLNIMHVCLNAVKSSSVWNDKTTRETKMRGRIIILLFSLDDFWWCQWIIIHACISSWCITKWMSCSYGCCKLYIFLCLLLLLMLMIMKWNAIQSWQMMEVINNQAKWMVRCYHTHKRGRETKISLILMWLVCAVHTSECPIIKCSYGWNIWM